MHFRLWAKPIKLSLTLMLLGYGLPALADTTLNFVDQSNKTGQVQSHQHLVRVEQAAADGVFMLFNSETKTLTVVNSQAKSFQVITPEQVEQTAAELRKAREQLKANFDKLPASQQAQLKPVLEQLQRSEKSKRTVKPSGSEKVANIKCQQHEVFVDGKLGQQICSANRKALGLSKQDYNNITAMLTMLADISRSFGAGEANAGVAPDELGGLPILTTDPNTKNFNRLASVNQNKLNASRFEVPSGYQPVRQ